MSDDAKKFADVAVMPCFHHALEASLSELQLSPPKGSDPAASWQQLEGAKRFISILLNLSEPPPLVRRGVPRENLQPT